MFFASCRYFIHSASILPVSCLKSGKFGNLCNLSGISFVFMFGYDMYFVFLRACACAYIIIYLFNKFTNLISLPIKVS